MPNDHDLTNPPDPPPAAAAPPAASHAVQTGGGDYAEGNIDKRHGTFVAGDQYKFDGDFSGAEVTINAPGHRAVRAYPSDPQTIAAAEALLATMPTDDVAAIPTPAALTVPARLPLRPNPLFVGRDTELRMIARQLKAGGTTVMSTGIGGIGKTQLAVEFAHRYGTYFAGGVFWIACANPAQIATEVAACGGPGVLELFTANAGLTRDEQVALVRHHWHSPVPRLLIFDNCDDSADGRPGDALLAEWLPPPTSGCRVLVTSRRATWDATLPVIALPLGVLEPAAAVHLLQSLYTALSAAEAAAIAAELGYLPLALHLAGSYLRRYHAALPRSPNETPAAAYLTQLRRPDLLQHPSLTGRGQRISPTAHEVHVAKTFALSLERLDPADPIDALARKALARAACLSPGTPFPRDLLIATLECDPTDATALLDVSDALERLMNLGLLEAEPSDGLRLHRLLALFAAEALNDAQARPAVEQALIHAARQHNDTGYPSAMQPIAPHLHHCTVLAQDRDDERAATLCTHLAQHLYALGDYAAARPYAERDLAIIEQTLGPSHPDTARSLNNLAALLQEMGDYAAARPLAERALAICEQSLGPTHPDTGTILNNLAALLQEMGDYAAARLLLERTLAICEQTLGPTHPYTATCLNNLALLLQKMGDYAAARPLAERALAIREAMLGPTHPTTATTLNNLAMLLQKMGDYAAARPLAERALAIREQTLGPSHPNTATTLNNLAALLDALGDYAAARPLYERALAIREQTLGPTHPDTATSLSNLAALLRALGDYAATRPLYERALAICEATLGPTHPDTAHSLNNLAVLLYAMGDYAAARPLLERALAIREATLGPSHPDTAQSLNNLAALLRALGDYAAARPLAERTLAIREATLGPSHPDTATSLTNLAINCYYQGQLPQAVELLRRALAIYEQQLGAHHPQTQASRLVVVIIEQQLAEQKMETGERPTAHDQRQAAPDAAGREASGTGVA